MSGGINSQKRTRDEKERSATGAGEPLDTQAGDSRIKKGGGMQVGERILEEPLFQRRGQELERKGRGRAGTWRGFVDLRKRISIAARSRKKGGREKKSVMPHSEQGLSKVQ